MKEILTHATAWMNLENVMLSEICQTQKARYWIIPSRRVEFIEAESRGVVARG